MLTHITFFEQMTIDIFSAHTCIQLSMPADSEPSFLKHSTVIPLLWIPQFWALNTVIPVKGYRFSL